MKSINLGFIKLLSVYSDLDKFVETWCAEDLNEFKKNTADFEKIDEDLWQ